MMNISVELTLTPLQDDFEAPIIAFINKVRESGLVVLENPLSTQIYGPYDEVMNFLQQEIKQTFLQLDHVLIHLKMVKSDRSNYTPHD